MTTLGAPSRSFIREHEYCGELDTGDRGGEVVWMTCACGAVLVRVRAMQLIPLEVRRFDDLEIAFQGALRGRAQALMAIGDSVVLINRARIVDFAAKNRLPAMYSNQDYMDAGGLMFYGPNAADMFRQSATFVDKILKGAKPANLPIEQPTKFELIINLKTAKALGLTIPPSVLGRADHVIK